MKDYLLTGGLDVNIRRFEASITGVPFYRKMGYEYKNGVTEPDEEHLIRMEKKREFGMDIC